MSEDATTYYKQSQQSNEVSSVIAKDSNLRDCFLELKPIHQRYLDGELTRLEYEAEKNYVLSKVK
jgi:hypothetical protein